MGEYYELVISTYSGLYRYNLCRYCAHSWIHGNDSQCRVLLPFFRKPEIERPHVLYGYEFSDFVADVEKMLQINIDFYQAKESAGKLTLIFQTEEKQKDLQQVSQMIEVLATSKKIILDARSALG